MVGSSQVTDKYPAIRRKKKPGQRSTYNKHPQSKPTQKGNVIITKTGHSIMYRGFITKSCRYWCAVYCVGWWRQVPTRAASCLLKQRISGRGGGRYDLDGLRVELNREEGDSLPLFLFYNKIRSPCSYSYDELGISCVVFSREYKKTTSEETKSNSQNERERKYNRLECRLLPYLLPPSYKRL